MLNKLKSEDRPWEITPVPQPTVFNNQTTLVLRPPLQAVTFAVESSWAETIAGAARRTRLHRTVDVHATAQATGWALTLRTTAPRLKKPALTAFDKIALLLTGLYEELVFDTAATGELRGLANTAAIRARWAQMQPELARQYPAGGHVIEALVAGVRQQLARPAGLWPSLPYNYLYAALPGSFYGQPFESNSQYCRPKVFPQFFDGLALAFTETLRLAQADTPAQVLLRLTGALAPGPTDLTAVAAHVGAALGPRHSVAPEELRFAYAATHCFVKSTGLPAHVELTVSCAYQDLYHKEYHLVIQSLQPNNLPL